MKKQRALAHEGRCSLPGKRVRFRFVVEHPHQSVPQSRAVHNWPNINEAYRAGNPLPPGGKCHRQAGRARVPVPASCKFFRSKRIGACRASRSRGPPSARRSRLVSRREAEDGCARTGLISTRPDAWASRPCCLRDGPDPSGPAAKVSRSASCRLRARGSRRAGRRRGAGAGSRWTRRRRGRRRRPRRARRLRALPRRSARGGR